MSLNPDSKKGKILISEPFLNDPYFKRSVVFLTAHDKEGSLGFILNKPVQLKLNEAVNEFPFFDARLYLGGPVKRDSLYFFHTIGKAIDDSIEVLDGLWWGGNFDTLKSMILQGKVKDNDVRFFAGYSGWEPEQLEKELQEKSWIIAEAKMEYVFGDAQHLWRNILLSMGNKYAVMANFPEDPSLN